MKRVLAAGGIVINRFNEVLLIYRRTMWDLPKGHIEKNETPETCALREVSEETGLKKLQITNCLVNKILHQMTRHVIDNLALFVVSEGPPFEVLSRVLLCSTRF